MNYLSPKSRDVLLDTLTNGFEDVHSIHHSLESIRRKVEQETPSQRLHEQLRAELYTVYEKIQNLHGFRHLLTNAVRKAGGDNA